MKTTHDILIEAKASKKLMAKLGEKEKNDALNSMADSLIAETETILKANREDVAASEEKLSKVMIDRLMLNDERIKDMAAGIRKVAELPDPVYQVISKNTRPNGLVIEKTRVPMGVIAVIYESRPNVTSDAAALCFKSSNVCVLRSGKEAWRSADAIVHAMRKGLRNVNLPDSLIYLVEDTSRASANELMTASGYVDLLIPRGGAGLIHACVVNATVPCIQTGTGICHIYVDRDADLKMALNIIENAKTSRPSVCNAEEVCIVHSSIAHEFLPMLKERLVDQRCRNGLTPVELRLDDRSASVIEGTHAGTNDFDTEFLDYILAVKTADDTEEAIAHIAKHSTGHSEAIITENKDTAEYFTSSVDSAAVYVNASTRFTDGGEFGLGCEMGISTQKLHARGPMGLEELCTYKYVIKGSGQIR